MVINEPVRRWRVTGTDLLPRFAEIAPLDVFGMEVAGLADHLGPAGRPADQPRRRPAAPDARRAGPAARLPAPVPLDLARAQPDRGDDHRHAGRRAGHHRGGAAAVPPGGGGARHPGRHPAGRRPPAHRRAGRGRAGRAPRRGPPPATDTAWTVSSPTGTGCWRRKYAHRDDLGARQPARRPRRRGRRWAEHARRRTVRRARGAPGTTCGSTPGATPSTCPSPSVPRTGTTWCTCRPGRPSRWPRTRCCRT